MAVYCATCGTQSASELLCEGCGLDPRLPKEFILRARGGLREVAVDLEYPGETTTLALAIITSVVVAGALALVSFGAAVLLIAVALIQLQFRERQLRDNALRVSDVNHPVIANLARLASFRLGVALPAVYVQADTTPNAYTAGFLGRHWIVLTSKLVELMKPDELLFIIGHELGHVRREHVSWMVLTSPRGGILLAPVRLGLNLIFTQWQQRAEFSADRAGVLACRSPDAAARALVRVTHWTLPNDLTEIEQAGSDPVFDASEWFESHPALGRRLRQVREFARAAERRGQI